jgi:hypothetical protein
MSRLGNRIYKKKFALRHAELAVRWLIEVAIRLILADLVLALLILLLIVWSVSRG